MCGRRISDTLTTVLRGHRTDCKGYHSSGRRLFIIIILLGRIVINNNGRKLFRMDIIVIIAVLNGRRGIIIVTPKHKCIIHTGRVLRKSVGINFQTIIASRVGVKPQLCYNITNVEWQCHLLLLLSRLFITVMSVAR